jgi:hypothetical protein
MQPIVERGTLRTNKMRRAETSPKIVGISQNEIDQETVALPEVRETEQAR